MKTMDAVTLLVNESHENHKSLPTLKKRLLQEMPNLEIHTFIFRPQIQIHAGEKVHRTIDVSRHGTLGMFGSWQGRDVAITGAHVIPATSSAYIYRHKRFVKIGQCIWPSSRDYQKSDFFNISVIPINDNPQGWIEVREGIEEVHIYDEKLSSLPNRKVFKTGADKGRTVGRIKEADFGFDEEDDAVLVIPEPDNQEGIFSKEGDSGSIVFTKIGTSLLALGVVYAGRVDLFEMDAPESSTLVVNFKNALQNFQQSKGNLTLKRM